MTALFMGVDVGAGGGLALIDERGAVIWAIKMPETDVDVLEAVGRPCREMPLLTCRATVERVASSPQMGVKSAFSFGAEYGRVRMALAAARVPFDEVVPLRWQRRLACLSGGDKNVTKARAQQVFPGVKVTHAIADALLLAEFCRLTQYVEERAL